MHIACVLTCHNRRAKTLQCLEALHGCVLPAGVQLSVHLVDDGSSDATATTVLMRFPKTFVIDGDGTLFWAGGMRRAMASAMLLDPDFYLWLNDDTLLDPQALSELLELHRELVAAHPDQPAIVSAAVRDPRSGNCTYGGVVSRSRWYPWFVNAPPALTPQRVATINGNCVLIPRAVVRRIGNIDPAYVHALGDWDYGLRAANAGCGVWLAAGTLGTCESNDVVRQPLQSSSLRRQLSHATGPKRNPLRPWWTFTSRHCGPLWLSHFARPYVSAAWQALRPRRLRNAKEPDLTS